MGKDSFRIDNPNAMLAIFGEKEPNDPRIRSWKADEARKYVM